MPTEHLLFSSDAQDSESTEQIDYYYVPLGSYFLDLKDVYYGQDYTTEGERNCGNQEIDESRREERIVLSHEVLPFNSG